MEIPWKAAGWIDRSNIIIDSYRQWLKKPLIAPLPRETLAQRLYHAPMVVVAHGTEADPVLNYGNLAALKLWEIELADFLRLHSRQTAQPMHRQQRSEMLARTARDGYIDDYEGIRISSKGDRFLIRNAVVWNLVDGSGRPAGQAASFSQWETLS